jgi:hypothetical protein
MFPKRIGKSVPASLSGTPSERRRNRLKPPSCSACGHDDSRVTLRTDYVLYFRCAHCAAVWSTPKPGHKQFGT